MPVSYINQYRKSIGSHNNKPQEPTKKSICKAYRKAHNAYESMRTNCNTHPSSSSASLAFKTVLTIAAISAVIAPTAAITNGQSRRGNRAAEEMFPFLRFGSKVCSGFKISARQVVTARHCGPSGAMAVGNSVMARQTNRVNHPSKDISILTFDQNLRGGGRCISVMTPNTTVLFEESPSNICGLKGEVLVAGRGRLPKLGELHTGVFRLAQGGSINLSKQGEVIRGVDQVRTVTGDSGAGILGCNPLNGKYEFIGTYTSSIGTSLGGGGRFVYVSSDPKMYEWLVKNTEGCVPRAKIAPKDIYDDPLHQWDPSLIPEKFYNHPDLPKNEICDSFCHKSQLPPASLNCSSTVPPSTNVTTELTTKSTIEPTELTIKPTTKSTIEPTELTIKPTTESTIESIELTTRSTIEPTTESTIESIELTTRSTIELATESTIEPTELTIKPTIESTIEPTTESTIKSIELTSKVTTESTKQPTTSSVIKTTNSSVSTTASTGITTKSKTRFQKGLIMKQRFVMEIGREPVQAGCTITNLDNVDVLKFTPNENAEKVININPLQTISCPSSNGEYFLTEGVVTRPLDQESARKASALMNSELVTPQKAEVFISVEKRADHGETFKPTKCRIMNRGTIPLKFQANGKSEHVMLMASTLTECLGGDDNPNLEGSLRDPHTLDLPTQTFIANEK